MLVLDTHVLIWASADGNELGSVAREQIQEFWTTDRVAVSAITFWETAMLKKAKRISLPSSVLMWRHDWTEAGLREIPVDGEVGILAAQLEMEHRDPADRIIVATAMRHAATLVTADAKLLNWPDCPTIRASV